MNKRTRIIAWIFLICTGFAFLTNILMYISIVFGYANSSWYLIAHILIWGFQWPFWIFLLRKQAWAWYVLTAIFAVLYAEWIFNLGRWIIDGMPYSETSFPVIMFLLGILINLVIIIFPFWTLLTDRPNMWNDQFAEDHTDKLITR